MKKFLFTLAAVLMASTAFAGHWVTFEAEDFDYTSGNFYLEKENVIIQGYGRVDYDHFRFYANNSLSVTNESGIMTIRFTCVGEDDGQYGPGGFEKDNEGQRGYYSYEGHIGLWEDGIYTQGEFTPFDEETSYNVEEGGINPMQTVGLYADYQVRCTKIEVYILEDAPVTPTEKTGAPVFNGYTTDGIHAYFVEINPTDEGSVIYYRVLYPGAEEYTEWEVYTDILAFEGDGKHRVEAYAVAPNKLPSEEIAYEFVVAPITGIDEMMSGKTISNVRYFNMAGQEMTEANGITIVVTTYTDGTTDAVKVVK